jgi:hypothetical protein
MPMVADYCLETTLTEGQVTYALEGAPAGKQRIVDGVGDGEGGFFIARGNPGEVNEHDKEIFWGVANSGSPHTLTRVTIFKSTDSDQKIAWGAGVKTIYSIPPGELISELAEGGYSASGTRPATVTARGRGHWIDASVSPRIAYWYDGAADIPKYLIDETANTVSLVGSGALLTSIDAGAAAGPDAELYRDSVSPEAGDVIGRVAFTGNSADTAGTKLTYAEIRGEIDDPGDSTDGVEDGALSFWTVIGGVLTRIMRLGAGLVVGNPSGGDQGAGSLNAVSLYLNGTAMTVPVLPRSYLAGLGLSNNGTDASHDIDIAAGAARSDDNDADMELASALTKRIDASWSVGTGGGGLDGSESVDGTPDADTWYHVFLIMRSDTGVVDALFSESATAPTLPANYDYQRRIGAVRTDGSANILAFSQLGDEFLLSAAQVTSTSLNPGTSAVTMTLAGIPTGIKVHAICNLKMDLPSSGAGLGYFSSLDQSDQGPGITGAPLGFETQGGSGINDSDEGLWARIRTNTSGQIRARLSASSTNDIVRVAVLGWVDRRGRDD